MKRIIYINNGIEKLLYPFKKWITNVKYINASKDLLGYEQYVYTVVLLDKNKNTVEIPINQEINHLCNLWDEVCFSDFLHSIIAELILDNSDLNSETIELYL